MVILLGVIVLFCMYMAEVKSDAQRLYERGEITQEQNEAIQGSEKEKAGITLILWALFLIALLMGCFSSL